MKKLILFFLFIPLMGMSQQNWDSIIKEAFIATEGYSVSRDTIVFPSDTVPMILLVSDTNRIETEAVKYTYKFEGGVVTFTQKAETYEEWIRCGTILASLGTRQLVSKEPVYRYDQSVRWIQGYKVIQYGRVTYLNMQKKPLNLLVWQTKH